MNNGRQNKYQDIYIQYATAKAQSFFLNFEASLFVYKKRIR